MKKPTFTLKFSLDCSYFTQIHYLRMAWNQIPA